MKKFILPLAAGFALGLSGAAMAGNVGSDHGKVAAQGHSIVATVSGPQLMTDAQLDSVVGGSVDLTNEIPSPPLSDPITQTANTGASTLSGCATLTSSGPQVYVTGPHGLFYQTGSYTCP